MEKKAKKAALMKKSIKKLVLTKVKTLVKGIIWETGLEED